VRRGHSFSGSAGDKLPYLRSIDRGHSFSGSAGDKLPYLRSIDPQLRRRGSLRCCVDADPRNPRCRASSRCTYAGV